MSDWFTTDDLMESAQITRAQVSHWMAQGYITPATGRRGQGFPLEWDARTINIARHAARFTAAGFGVEAAFKYAEMAKAYFDITRSQVWTHEEDGIIVGARRG